MVQEFNLASDEKQDLILGALDKIKDNIVIYDKPGVYTWNTPPGVNFVYVTLIGGGGGGGGGGSHSSNDTFFGSAGSSASVDSVINFPKGGPGANTKNEEALPGNNATGFGHGGSGASSGYKSAGVIGDHTNGSSGGVSSFSSIISVSGGSGGGKGSESSTGRAGGNGGGSGLVEYRSKVALYSAESYRITVGAGGAGGESRNSRLTGGKGAPGMVMIEW